MAAGFDRLVIHIRALFCTQTFSEQLMLVLYDTVNVIYKIG